MRKLLTRSCVIHGHTVIRRLSLRFGSRSRNCISAALVNGKILETVMIRIVISDMKRVTMSSATAPLYRQIVIPAYRAGYDLVLAVIIDIGNCYVVVSLTLVLCAGLLRCKRLCNRKLTVFKAHSRNRSFSVITSYRDHIRIHSVKICHRSQKSVNAVSVALIISPCAYVSSGKRVFYRIYSFTVAAEYRIIFRAFENSSAVIYIYGLIYRVCN